MNMLQPLLGQDKSNPLFELLFDPDIPSELLVYFGMHFLERVKRGSFEEGLLIGRFYNAGFSRKALQETFGYDRKTMQSWGNALKSGDIERIKVIGIGSGGARKLKVEHKRFIINEYKETHKLYGCHTSNHIRKKFERIFNISISIESIRLILNDEAVELPEEEDTSFPITIFSSELAMRSKVEDFFNNCLSVVEGVKMPEREFSCKNVKPSASEFDKNSNEIPSSKISTYGFPVVEEIHASKCLCHHAGILLCRIFIDVISKRLGNISDIIRQWIAMVLTGNANIEQGRSLHYRSLELLVGVQISSAYRQREILHRVACRKNVNLIFRQNILLINADYENDFFYDPHGVEYTGQLRTVKTWLGSKHHVRKGYNLDLIHTMKGEPVFSDIDDNYYDLRQRFLANINKFRTILSGEKNRTLTIIVDRAIYDVEFMRKCKTENVHIITWEKNYKKGEWDHYSKFPTKIFYLLKYKNSSDDIFTYAVRFFKRPWKKEKSFAQYIILLSKPEKPPVELSVICTDYAKSNEAAIKPILCRWIQENDIGYLILLGINQITSYSNFSYSKIAERLEDRNIDNKKYKTAMAQRLELKKDLGLLLVKREEYIEKKEQMFNKITVDIENKTDTDQKKLISKQKRIISDRKKYLQNNLVKQQELHQRIVEIEKTIDTENPKISRLNFLLENEYRKLNFMPKAFMDAVKINARNIIYELLEIFRPIYNNRRNDLVILRELINAGGFIEESYNKIMIYLNPTRQYQKKDKEKILLFLFQISNKINKFYRPEKTIIITLYNI